MAGNPWTGGVAAHSNAAPLDLSRQLDLEGDEYAELSTPEVAATRRSFRAAENSGYRNPPAEIAIGDNMTDRAQAHGSRGAPDWRHTDDAPKGRAAPAGPAAPVEQFMPEVYLNQRQTEARTDVPGPPDRPRQGFTGADPTRPSTTQRAYLLRPFDKGIAEHPGRILKANRADVHASRPFERTTMTGGLPNATGRTGTEQRGYSGHPNTFRLLPAAWDQQLLDVGGPAASPDMPDPAHVAASSQRARGWRA